MSRKRKREDVVVRVPKQSAEGSGREYGLDTFRKHFESEFAPLKELTPPTPGLFGDLADPDDKAELSTSEWQGVSEDEGSAPSIQVVDHSKQDQHEDFQERSVEFKSFMRTRAPREANKPLPETSIIEKSNEAKAETLNLKHDLALQKLLSESQLLGKEKKAKAAGHERHRSTDLQLQSLGFKKSLFEQTKMPLSHRKGIITKSALKERSRRSEAKENGVVLEKTARSSKAVSMRRDRGVDAPGVGHFRNGLLSLSRRDLANIQGPSRKPMRKGRR